ncbi:MAG: hypothetical protein WCS03_01340 [Bacteroidota bacterium]
MAAKAKLPPTGAWRMDPATPSAVCIASNYATASPQGNLINLALLKWAGTCSEAKNVYENTCYHANVVLIDDVKAIINTPPDIITHPHKTE